MAHAVCEFQRARCPFSRPSSASCYCLVRGRSAAAEAESLRRRRISLKVSIVLPIDHGAPISSIRLLGDDGIGDFTEVVCMELTSQARAP